MPVPKGTRIGGRQKGTPNKSTAVIRAAALKECPEMIKLLAKMAASAKTPTSVRVHAAVTILLFGVGKPKAMEEDTEPESLQTRVSVDVRERIMEITARIRDKASKERTGSPASNSQLQ